MYDIELSDKVLVEMAALAVEHSVPVGLGRLHFRPLTPEYSREIRERIARDYITQGGIYIDYFDGRMVKFNHANKGFGPDGIKRIQSFNDTISSDYQSWKQEFANYEELAIRAMINVEV